MTTQIQPVLTVADLDLMPEDGNRYEIIDGELYMSRAPSFIHQVTVGNIIVLIRAFLDRHPIGLVAPGPGVIFSDLTGVVPDVVFVSNERLRQIASGDKITGAPDLVIEILSPGLENERRDRVVKRQLYGRYGVLEYWLVDLINRRVEMYSLRDGTLDLAAIFGESDELVSVVLPGFRCPVQSIFAA
ncbi:MAG TPA: Uma2 family endonuclease [Blastocatellia bacterium]|nr:Uma2 family endonuclease [Blastocatellia bacterium]